MVDSGIDYTHPDLANLILRDANGNIIGTNVYGTTTAPNDTVNGIFVPPNPVKDDAGHGTACAGIAGATGLYSTIYASGTLWAGGDANVKLVSPRPR